jgi:hypothetical protein
LIAARDALERCDDDALTDCLGSNTAAQYRAIVEVIAECRQMLDEIEGDAIERVKMERQYYQARLDDINSLGDLQEPTIEAQQYTG